MKFTRFFKKAVSLMLTTVLFVSSLISFQVSGLGGPYGTEVPELLDLYKKYYNNDKIERLYFEESNSEYSSYCVIIKTCDVGSIWYNYNMLE